MDGEDSEMEKMTITRGKSEVCKIVERMGIGDDVERRRRRRRGERGQKGAGHEGRKGEERVGGKQYT